MDKNEKNSKMSLIAQKRLVNTKKNTEPPRTEKQGLRI
jgi:hypothetical protein